MGEFPKENEVQNFEQDHEFYVIFVHDFTPELMPNRAFREDKHFDTKNKKAIKCPHCGKVFITVDKTDKLTVMRYSNKASIIEMLDTAINCKSCKKAIGIIYAAA